MHLLKYQHNAIWFDEYMCLCSVAYRNCTDCMDDLDESRSHALKELLRDYFDKRRNLDMSKPCEEEEDEEESLNKCKVCSWNSSDLKSSASRD